MCSVDATHCGGLGRLCNDDDEKPNGVMKRLVVDGMPQSALLALRPISVGNEIRFDYGYVDGNMHWRTEKGMFMRISTLLLCF
jgi:hypothetical protein